MSDEDMKSRMIEVWNKADLISPEDRATSPDGTPANDFNTSMPSQLPTGTAVPKIFVSAVKGTGFTDLKNTLEVKLGFLYGHKKWAPPWVPDSNNGTLIVENAAPLDVLQ